jgi:hypothetical protein
VETNSVFHIFFLEIEHDWTFVSRSFIVSCFPLFQKNFRNSMYSMLLDGIMIIQWGSLKQLGWKPIMWDLTCW